VQIIAAKPKGAERLPPNIVVAESDLHMRRFYSNFLSFFSFFSKKGKEKKTE
jgi:hypothetical protein